MKQALKKTVGVVSGTLVLSALGLAASAPPDAAKPAPLDSLRVPILVYHSVSAHHPGQTDEQRQLTVDTTVFKTQMQYLAENGYRVIPLGTLVDALEGKAALPNRAVVITFDDGWQTQYHHAFPVLQQYGFTATFFIYTKPIGRDDSLYMNWNQVREMQSAGMTIGSHSRTHPLLTNPTVSLPDEVGNSRIELERQLGSPPEFFAYPYGATDARVMAAVEAAGYRAARAFPGGSWNSAANLFALRAVFVTDDMATFQRALGP